MYGQNDSQPSETSRSALINALEDALEDALK
jgi:hypothetical protein